MKVIQKLSDPYRPYSLDLLCRTRVLFSVEPIIPHYRDKTLPSTLPSVSQNCFHSGWQNGTMLTPVRACYTVPSNLLDGSFPNFLGAPTPQSTI